MPRRKPETFRYTRGFIPTQPGLDGVPDSLQDGRNLLIFGNGKPLSAKGPLAGGASGSPRPAMNVKAGFGGVSNYGTVLSFFDLIFAAGSGTVTLDGSPLGSIADQLVVNSGGLVVLGVGAPGAPTVSTSPPTAGRLAGAYSMALTAIQVLGNLTSESSRGTPSVAVSLTNKKFRVTAWPATPTGCVASRDKWGVYFPFRGFPTQGPWRHLIDIPMNTALPYDIDFLDGELGHLAPLDYDPPPVTGAKFIFTIDNVMTIVGPGGRLNPSVPLLPAAYPPDQASFLARGEDVTSCRSSGGSGRIALACANSVHEVIASGDATISPIITYPRWPSVGFVGSSSWCFVHDTIVGMSGAMGPVMGSLDSPPTSDFADNVKTFFEDNGFTSANTVVGYDPSIGAVIFMSGTLAVPYMGNGVWSAPVVMPGTVSTAVTVNGRLLVDISGTSYTFEGGTGTDFYAIPAWWDGNNEFLKTIVRMRAASDVSVTIQPLTDLSLTPVIPSFSSAAQHGNPKRLNLRNVTSFTAKISGTGSRKSIQKIYFQQITHTVTNHR